MACHFSNRLLYSKIILLCSWIKPIRLLNEIETEEVLEEQDTYAVVAADIGLELLGGDVWSDQLRSVFLML